MTLRRGFVSFLPKLPARKDYRFRVLSHKMKTMLCCTDRRNKDEWRDAADEYQSIAMTDDVVSFFRSCVAMRCFASFILCAIQYELDYAWHSRRACESGTDLYGIWNSKTHHH
jgi:hypothetical protein